ncbi:hypothetical protein ACJRO7_017298 [Eucalyptus globulus]|uniref:Protein yippee-like n=1 Tax=Eucalyptus globulus TaxID=34317 RepID=A0ABD3KRQ4_EUCGL
MGRPFLVKLKGRAYGCSSCNRPLVLADDWVAECHQGRPFLFINVVNITVGGEERLMAREGIIVKDIFCRWCGQCLGWKYVTALDKKEEYKEGKFMLERYLPVQIFAGSHINREIFNLHSRPLSTDARSWWGSQMISVWKSTPV